MKKTGKDAVIVSACRTAIGGFNGKLAPVDAVTLGSSVITAAIARAGINNKDVDEVIMSQVLPCGCGQNPARLAAVKAGLPWETGAFTINKVCGGGLKAIMLAAQAVMLGDAKVVVAGGMESMSNSPFYLDKARFGYRMGSAKIQDHMVHDGLWDVVNDFHMGISNDIISTDFNVSREDQDRYAAESYTRAIAAVAAGRFKDEIIPIEIQGRKGPVVFDTDENPKDTSYETLSAMRPAFQKEGFATAGNASVIADGASAVCVMTRKRAEKMGCAPLARIVAYGSSGLDMKHVLIAPIKSIPKVLKKAKLKIEGIQLHEINEAFAGSTVCVMRKLGLSSGNVNVNGGSIAIGHPIGASGARILTTLIYEMKKRGLTLGEASLCLGGGESVTMVVEVE